MKGGVSVNAIIALMLIAQAPVLPATVEVPNPGLVFVKAESENEVRWFSPSPNLQVIPGSLLKDSKTAVCLATTPGSYKLIAWSAELVNGEPTPTEYAETRVIVAGKVPPQPDPDPDDDDVTPSPQPDPEPEPDPDDVKPVPLSKAVYYMVFYDDKVKTQVTTDFIRQIAALNSMLIETRNIAYRGYSVQSDWYKGSILKSEVGKYDLSKGQVLLLAVTSDMKIVGKVYEPTIQKVEELSYKLRGR